MRHRRLLAIVLAATVVVVGLLAVTDPFELRSGGSRPRDDAEGTERTVTPHGLPTLAGREAPAEVPQSFRAYAEGEWPESLSGVDRERDLHGVVVATEGRPVVGARVSATFHPWRRAGLITGSRWDEEVKGPEAVTGADGAFAVRLAAGDSVDLVVEADGFATAHRRRAVAGERLRIVMEPGVVVSIEAVTPEGEAAVEVRLELRAAGSPVQTLTTDALGRARSKPLLPAESLWIGVPAQPVWAWASREDQGPLPARSTERSVRLVVRRGRTLTGTVTDVATGRPVPGASVGMGWTMEAAVTTGDDGRYVLTGWPRDGYHEIAVLAEGYGREETRVGSRDVVNVALTVASEIVGRVVGADGGPIAGAQVASVGSVHSDQGQRISLSDAVTSADGRFRLADLRHDQPHRLTVIAAGHGRLNRAVAAGDRPGARIDAGDLRLSAARVIAGRVLDERGGPRERLEVTLDGPPADEEEKRLDPSRQLSDYGRQETVETDDRGRFRFVDLSPGRYALLVVEREPLRASRVVDLPASEDRLSEDLTLARGRRIRVRPEDPDGNRVLPLHLSVRWAGGRRESFAFRIDDLTIVLPAGMRSVRIRAQAQDGSERFVPGGETVDVPDDADEARIVFRLGRTVSGVLRDEGGAAISRADVTAYRSGRFADSATTDEDGRFRVSVDGEEPVDLRFGGSVSLPGTESYRSQVALPLFAEATGVAVGREDVALVARTASSDRTLVVTVRDPDGQPAADVEVTWTPRAQGASGSLRTDRQGRATLSSLPPAALDLRIQVPKDRRETWYARLPDGLVIPQGQTVELRFVGPAILEGVVVTGEGATVSGAQVSGETEDEAGASATSDASGRFRLPVDPAWTTVDLESWSGSDVGTLHGVAVDVPVSGGPVRLVVAPHDGIAR